MVVHVSDLFYPRIGGIEVQVAALAGAQAATGSAVEVITASPADRHCPETHPYVVHRLASSQVGEVTGVRAPWLWRLLDRLAPTRLHLHLSVYSPVAFAAAAWSMRHRVATVVSVHSLWGGTTQALFRVLNRRVQWSQRLLVTTVSAHAAAVISRAVPDLTPLIVPNGIALEEWRRTGTDYVRSDRSVHVVGVGRLRRRRQPLGMLRVLQMAASQLPAGVELRGTLVGSGPQRPAAERFLERHGLTGMVDLRGQLERTEVSELLRSADIFLNPCEREAFGLATLEARAAGVPVVARKGTGVEDFITDGVEGLLCDGVAGQAGAVARLARDPALRARIANHNRVTPPDAYDWQSILPIWDDCYRQAEHRRELRPTGYRG